MKTMEAPIKRKAVEGHKCRGVAMWITVSCQCGWRSDDFRGDGARANAYEQWRRHVEKCDRAGVE